MVKSMTAYGRGRKDSIAGRWVVELHSVNRKALEIQVYLPRDCLQFDMQLRKWLVPSVQRGQVTIRATQQCDEAAAAMMGVSQKLKNLQEMWTPVAADLGYDPAQAIDLRFLLERMAAQGGQERQDESQLEGDLRAAFDAALQEWQAMRELEGEVLAGDIKKRVKQLSSFLEEVERQGPQAIEEYRLKLTARLKEISQDLAIDEERVMREVVILAEKVDITEEMVRLRSHFAQMENLLSSNEKGIGRTMEFLVQEMHREMNTLGAKSADLVISRLVVSMKAELDKIREQVQNIE
jgi:uncharacterized protein (TIGR00255 family)